MRLRDLRVGKKQAIGFGVILVIMASVNAFTVARLVTLKRSIDVLTREWFPSTVATASIGKNTSQLRMLQLQHAIADDDSTRQALATDMVALIDAIEHDQDVIQQLLVTPEGVKRYAEYERLWERYLELGYEFLRLSLANQEQAAIEALTGEAQSVFDDLVVAVDGIVTMSQEVSRETAVRAEHTFQRTRSTVRFLGLVTLIVSILIAVWLSRWITVPMRELASASERVSEGRLDVRVTKHGEDEIGQVADSFNSMVDSLRTARERVMTAQRGLEAANSELETKNRDLEAAMRKLRETQQQLVMSEKMAALGNLVAGVAHEINNPVGAVGSAADTSARSIEVMRRQIEAASDLAELHEDKRFNTALQVLLDNNSITVSASERITQIVRSLKNFARLDESEFQEADVHEGLDSTLTLLHHELKRRIEVVKEYGSLPPVQCFPGQLNQVFMNILANAAQSIDGDGRITIRTRTEGEEVVIEISDTGRGISKENLERIFDPGFTTKGVGVGTGLGLSISYNIIEKHHGRIEAESERGKGTTMRIRLPVRQEGART